MNVSQDRLSKLSDITYKTIIKIESGTIRNQTMGMSHKITKALGINLDDLIK